MGQVWALQRPEELIGRHFWNVVGRIASHLADSWTVVQHFSHEFRIDKLGGSSKQFFVPLNRGTPKQHRAQVLFETGPTVQSE